MRILGGILAGLMVVAALPFPSQGEEVTADPQPAWPPVGILGKLIEGAQKSGDPLASHHYLDDGREFSYELYDAKYLGIFEVPDPPHRVYAARLFFIRSSAKDSEYPPARGHHFVVYFDESFKPVKLKSIERDFDLHPEAVRLNWNGPSASWVTYPKATP